MSIDNTFNNLNLVYKKDDSQNLKITTSPTISLNLNYDTNLTEPKKVSLGTQGLTLAEASNNIPYPITQPPVDYQTRVDRSSNDGIDLSHIGSISLNKKITPSFDINNLTYTETTQLSSIPIQPVSQANGVYRCVFKENNKVIWGIPDNTTFTKTFYVQNFTTGNMDLINLSALQTGADNYIGRLNTICIAQIIPVYYTSQSNCKFFIRLSESSANNNFYIITCAGDPTLLSSYSYSTNYLLAANSSPSAGFLRANGSSFAPLTTISNGVLFTGQRVSILDYDMINDNFITLCSDSSIARQFISIVNSSLTGVCTYTIDLSSLGLANSVASFRHYIIDNDTIGIIFNNNAALVNFLTIIKYDKINFTVKISPLRNVYLDIPPSTYVYNGNFSWETYSITVGGIIYYYFFTIDVSDVNNKLVKMVKYSWNENILNSPVYVSIHTIQNISSTPNQLTNAYSALSLFYSIRVRNINTFEIFSNYTNNTGTGNDGTLFLTIDNFATVRTMSITNICSGNPTFMPAEQESAFQVNLPSGMLSTIYPQHIMARCSTNLQPYIYTDVKLLSLNNPDVLIPKKYLTFNYNLTSELGTIELDNGSLKLDTSTSTKSDASLTLSTKDNVAGSGEGLELIGNTLISNTANTSSGNYLTLKINGVVYKIDLLQV